MIMKQFTLRLTEVTSISFEIICPLSFIHSVGVVVEHWTPN